MAATDDPNPPKRRRRRTGQSSASLGQVAELAGVSTATVSRAFNNPDRVSEAMRSRIFKAAEQLNWVPNAAGRALASARTRILGAVIPTLDNEIFARQVLGLQDGLSPHGYTLFLGCSRYCGEAALTEVRAMLEHGVEGIMLVGRDYPDTLFRLLRAHRTPHVLSYIYDPGLDHPTVGFRHDEIFAQLTRAHLEAGHRRFALIFQNVEGNSRVADRLRGVRETLAEAAAPLPEDQVLIGEGTLQFGADSLRRLMSLPEAVRPSAIICGNDTLAIGALSMAQRMGLQVPKDFAISGFDNTAISEMTAPPLYTAEIDNYLVGREAAEMMLRRLKNRKAPVEHLELQPRLIARASI
ncbi:LacI family transcriptional regulator [Salipiger pallidus]|uniref:LacI family transcriptional regulator n=1 Tax=Salipiger pallidus TaxID=1775170 RepID=A0A8J2ZMT4_9RHOB|nr:LacI family DNA-binding transcriptional regulator [Salipiger pallidus]GGG83625.1 LacI family transcriptional regulator [Salipiger pallidus]